MKKAVLIIMFLFKWSSAFAADEYSVGGPIGEPWCSSTAIQPQCIDPDGCGPAKGVIVKAPSEPIACNRWLYLYSFQEYECWKTSPCCEDKDGDKHNAISGNCLGGDDCNDNDASIYPGATEICDNKDNDCDGSTDENVSLSVNLLSDRNEFSPSSGERIFFRGLVNYAGPFQWTLTAGDQTLGSGSGSTVTGIWNGKDASGRILPPGIYPVTLRSSATNGPCSHSQTVMVQIVKPKDCLLEVQGNSTFNVASGNVSHSQELFAVKGGSLPLHMSLSYQSLLAYDGPLGQGWSHNYDIHVTKDNLGNVVLRKGLGGRSYFADGAGGYRSQAFDHSVLTKSAKGYLITETDGQKYRFDTQGRITAIEDRFGNAISFAYPADNPTRMVISDPLGRQINLYYRTDSLSIKILPDGSPVQIYNKLDRIIDPAGQTYNFTYHADTGRLWQVIVPEPRAGAGRPTWTYLYDAAGYLEYKTDPEQNVVRYVYNPDHTLKESYDPQLQKKSASYNSTTSTTTVTEKDDGQWIYKYDPNQGVLLSKTDPAGNVTSYTYNTDGRELSRTEPGHVVGEHLTVFSSYDSQGRHVAETEPVNLATYGLTTASITSYEQLGTLTPPIKTAFRTSYNDAYFGQIASISDERGPLPLTTEGDQKKRWKVGVK